MTSKKRKRILRATIFFRGTTTTPAMAATDEPLLAILPAAPIPVAATALVVYNPDVVDDPKEITRDWLSQHVNRLLISRYYSEALSSSPLCEWNLRGGTFALINRVFPSLSRNLIKSVVTETYLLENDGKKYVGSRKKKRTQRCVPYSS